MVNLALSRLFLLYVIALIAAGSVSSSPSSFVHASPSSSSKGNVLFVAAVSSKSHKNFYYGLVEAMVSDGHRVTLISPYPPSRRLPNVTEVVVPDNDLEPLMPNPFNNESPVMNIQTLGPRLCFDALAAPQVTEALKQEFDLVLVSAFFCDCFLPLLHARQIPFGLVVPGPCIGAFCEARSGLPYFPSLESNPVLGFENPQGFWQRAAHSLVSMAFVGYYRYYLTSSWDAEGLQRGLYPPDTPPLWDIYKNYSIVITNSFRLGNDPPRPSFPNFLEAGGLQCKEARPLPEDLEDWVEGSKEAGFIFFSLGSAVRAGDLSAETLAVLTRVFARLPQRVLWKFNLADLPGLPPNVRLTKWAPQQDLLGHAKLRLFITHGGLLSTQEATFHGVPVLGLPVFGDQHSNMEKAQREGWGRLLTWKDLTEQTLEEALHAMMEDHGARAVAARVGAVQRDHPRHPALDVAWWAGYLVRTGGAPHLKAAAGRMAWYEVYNVDVWLVMVSLLVAVLIFTFLCLRRVWRRCRSRGKTSSQKVKTK